MPRSATTSAPPGTRVYRLRPRRRRLGRVLAVLLLALVGAHLGWTAHSRRQLARQLEPIRWSNEPIEPADFFRIDPEIPDAENGALDLRRAAAAMHLDLPAWQRLNLMEARPEHYLPPGLPPDHQALAREVIEAEAPALRLAAEAARKPRMFFPLSPASPMILTPVPDVNGQNQLTDLVQLAAVEAFERGDHAAALEWVGLMLRIADALGGQPTPISHEVGLSVASAAARTAADFAPMLEIGTAADAGSAAARPATPAKVRALVDALLDEQATWGGNFLAIRSRRAEIVEAMVALAEGKGLHLRDVLRSCPTESDFREWTVTRPLVKPLVLADAALVCRLYTELLEASDAPTWPSFMARAPEIDGPLRSQYPLHAFACLLARDDRWKFERFYLTLARRRCTAVALAVGCYACDHGGRRPERLEELVPDYLPSVPLDPFAHDGGALAYGDNPERPVVYSVGPDGIDDGGSALRPPRHSMTSTPDDPVDVVVHLDRRLAGVVAVERSTLVRLGRVRPPVRPTRPDGSLILPAPIRLPP